jgi:hypothetical protein
VNRTITVDVEAKGKDAAIVALRDALVVDASSRQDRAQRR